jgi:hypothetical protein
LDNANPHNLISWEGNVKRIIQSALALSVLSACSSYSTKPESFVLPTSNKKIDTVLHRSDVRFMDCGTLSVLQTYDAEGKLIDAAQARGSAFHCVVVPSLIEAGGRVGAAAVTEAARTTVNNAVSNAGNNIANAANSATAASSSAATSSSASTASSNQTQGQSQGQKQGQSQLQGQVQNQAAFGGNGGQGGTGGNGGNGGNGGDGGKGGKGNNGKGNGGHDGSPNGKDDEDR